jgi:hypothetical protein
MKILACCMASTLAVTALPAFPQSLAAAQVQELSWPQSFDVQGPQVRSYGFAVTQAGPVVVTVQSQGAPLTAAVLGPLPNPLPAVAPQSGPGTIRFTYNLTPQDLQRGLFWQIDVRLAPNVALQPGARASGSIVLQRPAVNPALVQQAAQARLAQHRTPTQERAQLASQDKARLDAAFTARKAQLAQRLTQYRAAVLTRLQPTMDAMRRQKAALTPVATTPSAASDQLHTRGLQPVDRKLTMPAPPPNITLVSIANNQDTIPLAPGSYGQPGDEVTITGTGFGATDGEVHFVIGPLPSQDMVVPANNQIWLATQIMAPVPTVSGVLPYAGALYVKRLTDGAKSVPVAFQFEPNVEQREIRVLADAVLQQLSYVDAFLNYYSGAGPTDVYRYNGNFFSGVTGTDRFYVTTRLKNGWKTTQTPITYTRVNGYTGGAAWVVSAAVGTDALATSVGFAVNPMIAINDAFDYGLVIPIQGPSGIPDGVVCINPPPSGGSCPQTDTD